MNHFISEGLEAELYTLAGPASNRWRLFLAPVFSAASWDLKASSQQRDLTLTRMGCGPIVLPGEG